MQRTIMLAFVLALAAILPTTASAHRIYNKPVSKLTHRQLHRENAHARGYVKFMRHTKVGRRAIAAGHRSCTTVKSRKRRGRCYWVRERVRNHVWLLRVTDRKLRPPVVYSTAVGEPWLSLAGCESSGNWAYNGSSGFDGGLQFEPGTWSAYRRNVRGAPPYAYQASPAVQVAVARLVLAAQGWGAWPECSAKLGLR